MKSCSKFLRNQVVTVHFADRNWISKTVYCPEVFYVKGFLKAFFKIQKNVYDAASFE